MKLLLDTCVYLWWISDSERLSMAARQALSAGHMSVTVSVVTLWEVLLKHGKGHIGLDTDGATALDFLLAQCRNHNLDVIPIGIESLRALETLPDVHHDPFDRLLICQAIEHGLTVVTPDVHIQRYPIRTLW